MKSRKIPSLRDIPEGNRALAVLATHQAVTRAWYKWHIEHNANNQALTPQDCERAFSALRGASSDVPGIVVTMKTTTQWDRAGGVPSMYHAALNAVASLCCFERLALEGKIDLSETDLLGIKFFKEAYREPFPVHTKPVRETYEILFAHFVRIRQDFEKEFGRPLRSDEFVALTKSYYPVAVSMADGARVEEIALHLQIVHGDKPFTFKTDAAGIITGLTFNPPDIATTKRLFKQAKLDTTGWGRSQTAGTSYGCPALQASIPQHANPIKYLYDDAVRATLEGFWPHEHADEFNASLAAVRDLFPHANKTIPKASTLAQQPG